jgi:Fe-S cluster assembly scaffold protein SufB
MEEIIDEYKELMEAYDRSGGVSGEFSNPKIPSIIISGNKVLGKNTVEGLILESEPIENGVSLKIVVKKGTKILFPMKLCFGLIPREGIQIIDMHAVIEDDAGMNAISHCVFPNAEHIVHKMNYKLEIGKRSFFRYNEIHFHGESGGIEVIPYVQGVVGEESLFEATFTLKEGRVGLFDTKYDIEVMKNGKVELYAKIWGKGNDNILIEEKVALKGENARALVKSKVVLQDNAHSKVISDISASAPYARGHIDCTEIVQGDAVAEAVPIVNVSNKFAKVTHEAAIGSLDSKEIETLEARGLQKEDAIKVLVNGILR